MDKAVEPLVATVALLQGELVTMRRTMVRGMVAMGVVNLLAVGMLLAVALPVGECKLTCVLATYHFVAGRKVEG